MQFSIFVVLRFVAGLFLSDDTAKEGALGAESGDVDACLLFLISSTTSNYALEFYHWTMLLCDLFFPHAVLRVYCKSKFMNCDTNVITMSLPSNFLCCF